MALTVRDRLRLGAVRPELAALAALLFDAAASLGYTLVIAVDGGTRSTAKQRALYADSIAAGGGVLAYPVATPGSSRHEYGAAFDVAIVAGDASDAGYREIADGGRALGLTAGYYFSHSDPFHFELAETLSESIDRWNALELSRSRALAIVAAVAAVLALAWWLTMRKH